MKRVAIILGGLLALYFLAAVTAPAQTLQHSNPAPQKPIVLVPNTPVQNPSHSKMEVVRSAKPDAKTIARPDVLPARTIDRTTKQPAEKPVRSDVAPMHPELRSNSQAK